MGLPAPPLTVQLEDALGFTPHEGQVRALFSTSPLMMVCAGRGWGKSTASVGRGLIEAQEPENIGLPGALLCPTYRQLKRVYQPAMEKMCRAFQKTTGRRLLKKFWKSEMRYELDNGSEVWLLSYERYENLRSFTLAWAGVDEITAVSDEQAVLDVLLPAVRGAGSGRIWFMNTPRGLRGLVKTFVDEVRTGSAEHQIIHGTSYDNPVLNHERIARMRRTMGKAQARQEFDAALLRPSNLVYPEFKRAVHLRPWQFEPRFPYSFWVDWGDSHPAFLQVQHGVPIDGVPSDIVVWQFVEDEVPWARGREVLLARARECGRQPEQIVGDRAVKSEQHWAAQAFRGVTARGMESREEQAIWRGVQVVKGRLDPIEGPPLTYMASHLAQDTRPRSIVPAAEQYKRCLDPASHEPLDKPYKDNVTDHAMDAWRMGHVARYGGHQQRPSIPAALG